MTSSRRSTFLVPRSSRRPQHWPFQGLPSRVASRDFVRHLFPLWSLGVIATRKGSLLPGFRLKFGATAFENDQMRNLRHRERCGLWQGQRGGTTRIFAFCKVQSYDGRNMSGVSESLGPSPFCGGATGVLIQGHPKNTSPCFGRHTSPTPRVK